jgi:hypothetical protein
MKDDPRGISAEEGDEPCARIGKHIDDGTRKHNVETVDCSGVEQVTAYERPSRPQLTRRGDDLVGIIGARVDKASRPPPFEKLSVGAGTGSDL